MAVSGAAFRIAWNGERLDGGNLSTLNIGDDPTEHIRRMFGAVGWVPRLVGNSRWPLVEEGQPGEPQAPSAQDLLGSNLDFREEPYFRDWIVEELYFKKYPMLALGVIFPPECNLLAGYDEGGDILIGWTHFADWLDEQAREKISFEPDGFFRKRDWFSDTAGLIGFDYKTGKPTLKETYRSALDWAVELGRTERFGRRYSGLAAYSAWAGMLKEDEAFAEADAGALDWRLMCHNDTLGATWEGRMYAAEFLRTGAQRLPRWAEAFEAAASSYAAEISLFEQIAGVLGGFGGGPEKARAFARPENRNAIAALILEARALDERALECLEKNLV
jgi:hypothetical protein